MADVKIYGPPQSSYLRSVRMLCEEKGVDYEVEPIEFGNAAHLALHPFGKVPAMRHNDVALFESAAIMSYIDAAFDGPSFTPEDPAARGRMVQWMSSIIDYAYEPMIRRYVLGYIFPKGPDRAPDRAAIDAAVADMGPQLDVIDNALADTGWLAGDYGMADMLLAPIMFYINNFPEGGELVAKHANVGRFNEAIGGRASFQSTMPPPPPSS